MEVWAALDASEAPSPHEDPVNPADLTMSELADYIEATHHAYLQEELPRLAGLVEKVADVHGGDFPWIAELAQVYGGLAAELESHMMKEEQILFPMVRQLETAPTAPEFHCGDVDNPIGVMEMEHDSAGAALRRLRELSSGYHPPQGACVTFRTLLEDLERLEADIARAHPQGEQHPLRQRQ
jgi:regulator of cell morphogenesis and NO signaling